MDYLRRRALRFSKSGRLEGDELDSVLRDLAREDETAETSSPSDSVEEDTGGGTRALSEEEIEKLVMEEEECVQEAIRKGLLKIHGTPPNKKKDGIFRVTLENCNGFNNIIAGNEKLEKAVEQRKELEADAVGYVEHRLNLRHKQNTNDFRQMFQREDTVKAVGAHNVHENVAKVQEGGTALIAFGETTAYAKKKIKDDTGLGRFTGMRYCGSNGHSTSIITAYNPCKNKKVESNTSYQQHRRYFINHKDDKTCPNKLFRRDLIALLKKLRGDGDKIMLFMDHNEHIYDDPLGRSLADLDGLAMKEAVQDFTGEKLGATFFRGTRPIDGLWVTGDLDISNVCVMPVGYGVGDHRMFIIDIPLVSLIGEDPIKIVPPEARRLNSRLPYVEDNYIEDFEEKIIDHRLLERLHEAHTQSASFEEVVEKVEKVDAEGKDYMKHAEKICRKIKSCKIPYSPESSLWIKRSQVYKSLLRYHKGKISNIGNLKRTARRCNIKRCTKLSVEEIYEKLRHCEEKCEYYKRHGRKYRYRHLNARVKAAEQRGDEEAAAKIEAIIQREKTRAWWRKLTFVTGKKRAKSVTSVQVDEGDGIFSEITGQHEVEQAIFKAVHEDRYQMAEESPICQGDLRGEFGYLADTPSAKSVLNGTYKCAPDTPQSIREIFAEIARIRKEIPEASTKAVITPDQWKEYWKAQKEETSSSESGLHFGHYKVGAKSDIISHYHAARVSIILAWGIALTRWSRGLTVMLEKVLGCNLVTKLRAILLMEADFNATNKIVYGSRMMDTVRQHGMMPEEVFSEKNRMADDGTLAKTLFYDVTRQARIPAALASVDASNCYDRIAHAIASLVFQAFGVPVSAAKSMLGAIEEMKFFLRTGFGDSTNSSGGSVHIKTQGMCQGNGGGPAAWAVVSIVILSAHKKKRHGAKFVCPISNFSHHLSSVLYVDDNDLLHINMEKNETVFEAHEAIQSSINSWGNLLVATGGALKPPKCFYSLISFAWRNGKWSYADNHLQGEFGVTVPLPDGSQAPIQHYSVKHSEKTLGAMTAPDGNSEASLRMMQTKAQDWVDDVKKGKLNRGMVWFSMGVQFWPRVGFSICNSMATFDELAAVLQSQYYQILSIGGVVRTAPRESRMIDSGFYGVGLPHPGVEALIGMSNKLLMHYGCKSAVGLLMKSSLELLMLEVGMGFQPLRLKYSRYSCFATHSWLKMLWEKLSMFGFKVDMNDTIGSPPRRNDRFLNQIFEDIGLPLATRLRLNRVRIHQEVLYFSDVTTASGAKIEPEKLLPRPPNSRWSSFSRWPTEKPTPEDFKLWQQVLESICPSKSNSTTSTLGEFTSSTHRIWRWKWCPITNELLNLSPDVLRMDIYRPENGTNRFVLAVRDVPVEDRGILCSVDMVERGQYRISSKSHEATLPSAPSNFIEVLKEWGCMWLWKDMSITGGLDWVAEAIADGTLLAVTDGSYIRELHPHICSAAFILECTKGRGQIIGHFSEKTLAANAYRGELLGLMAIHLLLLSVNKVQPNLGGEVDIVSDCLGALCRVSSLPPHRIPTRCKHSDILKNILINCRDMSFTLMYSHVKAHQDDNADFNSLSRKSQLNCVCDGVAKEDVRATAMADRKTAYPFPLEAVCMYVEGEKITSDTAAHVRFAASKQLAKEFLVKKKILSKRAFNEVDWKSVHGTLHGVPKMFQLWAAKQVLDIAGTMKFLSYQDKRSPLCPSCGVCVEDCEHILTCTEVGRTAAFEDSVEHMGHWMRENYTRRELVKLLRDYILGRGKKSCLACARGLPQCFKDFAASQDTIGWRRFMEGMVSKRLVEIQRDYLGCIGSRRCASKWISGLITQLLQVTHSQWLYRNVVVHDRTTGTLIAEYKEELLKEIDRKKEIGVDGLLQEDRYLLEINHDDWDVSNGEREEYWLLAIQAARKACLLSSQGAAAQQSSNN